MRSNCFVEMKKLLPVFLLAAAFGLSFFLNTACKREPVFLPVELVPIDTIIDPVDPPPPLPVNTCNPDSVYFDKQVLPIFTSNCATTGCHDVASHQQDIILTSYEYVMTTGKIKLANPASSKIYSNLGSMPPSPRPKLTNDQKALILKWIQQGGQNLHCSDGSCDTSSVKYATSVKPLIDFKCKGCHGPVSPGGGFRLTNYAETKIQADNGKLWGAINHAAGFKPMPYPIGNSKLEACELAKIQIWLAQGAPDN